MITQAVMEAVLLDIQSRERSVTPDREEKLTARCENFMIDIDVVRTICGRVLSMNLEYLGGGGVAVDAETAVSEAFIAGVICGRMETATAQE